MLDLWGHTAVISWTVLEQWGEISKGSLLVFAEASFQGQKIPTEQTSFGVLSMLFPAEGLQLVILSWAMTSVIGPGRLRTNKSSCSTLKNTFQQLFSLKGLVGFLLFFPYFFCYCLCKGRALISPLKDLNLLVSSWSSLRKDSSCVFFKHSQSPDVYSILGETWGEQSALLGSLLH